MGSLTRPCLSNHGHRLLVVNVSKPHRPHKMKLLRNSRCLLIAAASGLLIVQQSLSQGTLYVSNLGQPPNGSLEVGRDSWCAAFFRTGTNSAGYLLNSIQLLMSPQVGAPSGIIVSIYQYDNRFPGNSLGVLTGPEHRTASS